MTLLSIIVPILIGIGLGGLFLALFFLLLGMIIK